MDYKKLTIIVLIVLAVFFFYVIKINQYYFSELGDSYIVKCDKLSGNCELFRWNSLIESQE